MSKEQALSLNQKFRVSALNNTTKVLKLITLNETYVPFSFIIYVTNSAGSILNVFNICIGKTTRLNFVINNIIRSSNMVTFFYTDESLYMKIYNTEVIIDVKGLETQCAYASESDISGSNEAIIS